MTVKDRQLIDNNVERKADWPVNLCTETVGGNGCGGDLSSCVVSVTRALAATAVTKSLKHYHNWRTARVIFIGLIYGSDWVELS